MENISALIWHTDDVRNAVECFSQSDQNKFYQIVGDADTDLRTYLEYVLESREDLIIEFINEQIADAVAETLSEKD